MTRLAAGLAAAGVALAACAGEPAAGPLDGLTIAPGTLTACIAPAPGLALEPDAGLEGFDVAVLRAVADELELDLDVVSTSFDGIVSGVALNGGRCDVAAGGVVADPGLASVVTTTTTPYRTVHRLVVTTAPGDEVAPGEVQGRVAVEAGGPAADAAPALSSATVAEYPSRTDLGRALATGTEEQALVTVAGRAALEDQLGARLTVRSAVPTDEQTVLLLPLGADERLVAAVDEAVAELAATGRLEELATTWLRR